MNPLMTFVPAYPNDMYCLDIAFRKRPFSALALLIGIVVMFAMNMKRCVSRLNIRIFDIILFDQRFRCYPGKFYKKIASRLRIRMW